MKATELRIGNWIHHKYSEPNFIVSVINTFNENTVNGIELEDCEPIPLTEEWLLKFGFEIIINNEYNCKMYVKYFDGTDYIGVDAEDFSLGTYLNNKIAHAPRPTFMSVHQLQNLYFALTNEELCIN